MHPNKLIKSVLALILFLSAAALFNAADTKASSTKTGWVSISSGTLNVRSGPGTNYKSVGSLKNNTQVTVYSQTKSGWSEIRYNKKKAYVSTKFLRMYSYLMDKTKVYTFKSGGHTYRTAFKSKEKDWDEWIEWKQNTSDDYTLAIAEDNLGLYSGEKVEFVASDGYDSYIEFYQDLAYPIKLGKEWDDWGTKKKITSVNGTLKTPAGTFKSVVTVKSEDGYVNYFAPNVGFIKGTYNGKTTSELIKVTKK